MRRQVGREKRKEKETLGARIISIRSGIFVNPLLVAP